MADDSSPDDADDADVPSPIDLRSMGDASRWTEETPLKRPWREDFFGAIVEALRNANASTILELGSGPGHLAGRILEALDPARYTALDFSDAMHTLAREHLGPMARRVEFVMRDFLAPDWTESLPRYDAVVTIQSIHELRHKRRAPALYGQVRDVLAPDGVFLACDHYAGPGGMANTALFMTRDEHVAALTAAGFDDRACLLDTGGMVLYCGTCKIAATTAPRRRNSIPDQQGEKTR